MVYMSDCPYRKNELYHHGIKGQRWGVRRFQNEDGTLTEAGKRRYYKSVEKDVVRYMTAKAATGKGAGTRRKILNQELEQKFKDKQYKDTFDEILNNPNMELQNKAYNKADKLRKHEAIFSRGSDLDKQGKTVSNVILSALGTSAIAAATAYAARYYSTDTPKIVQDVTTAMAGITVASAIGKGAYDATSLAYYKKHKNA